MGLLSRLAKQPEVLAAVLGGSGGALLGDDDTNLGVRIAAGAGAAGSAMGLTRSAARGLLSRVGQRATKADVDELVRAARVASGQSRQQAGQFPKAAATEAWQKAVGARQSMPGARPAAPPVMPAADVDIAPLLSELGYKDVLDYQIMSNLPATGKLDERTYSSLVKQVHSLRMSNEAKGLAAE